MKISRTLVAIVLIVSASQTLAATSILFIGNSFTYGQGSAVRFYRSDTVSDLNNQGIGGVPALFKSFTDQAGLDFDVNLETQPGSGLEFHIENKLGVIGRRPWDTVVMHGQSTLDFGNPGDSAKLIVTSKQLAEIFQQRNSAVEVYLTATWSRADQIYRSESPWAGTPIEQMALDVRQGNDQAAASSTVIKSVNPVGEAWTRAMQTGVADPNPYDGIDVDKIDLWTFDHYHASTFGYYLEALIVFGNVTGLDPRSLSANECSGFELGMSQAQVSALQQVAFDQLVIEQRVSPAPYALSDTVSAVNCAN